MQVDILYFEGCPNSGVALERVRDTLASERIVADVRMIEIRDAEHAIARRFLGSPTIHIDGRDAEPEARLRDDYGYMCRTYRASDDSVAGAPPRELILKALRTRR